MVSAMAHLRPGYGKAFERMKQFIDKGKGPDDVQRGSTPGRLGAASGPSLADLVVVASEYDDEVLNVQELNGDLSFILVDKAIIGSGLPNRI